MVQFVQAFPEPENVASRMRQLSGSVRHDRFREDLKKITLATLVIHGDADAIVPIEGSGERTHRAIGHSQMVRVSGAPHGMNVSHATAYNDALLAFLTG
jgi:pimeloyl-ACP methyl ester carboxylesterase